MNDALVRKQLTNLLTKSGAHMNFSDAVEDFPEEWMNKTAPHVDYTFWDLLEHIRRTQADILEYIVSDNYQDKQWPQDYWPKKGEKANQEDWEKTLKDFAKDQRELVKVIEVANLDRKLPNNETVLREILVVADHNAYHLGEFAILRQVCNLWPKDHK